ncbi:hypothetical protein [Streptomyces sp. CYG21]|nr:hypothetical protein [Streptomyces sp. CYG21]
MDAEGHVMADEQYEWLDKDAAEKLLRGEPVVPLGDQARDDALRLAEALGAARAARRAPAGELPGEDAVLTAFRQATRSGRDRLAGRSAGPALPGQPGTLHSVHIGAAPAAPPRRPRWSRPVRFGLAVSLAGCALGGVAVAAGTGVLPGPFGGQDSPAPASSVSAATPEPLVSGLPAEDPSTTPRPSPPDDPDPLSSPENRQSGTPEEAERPETGGIDAEADGGDRTGDRNRPDGSGGAGASGGADAAGGSGGSGRENATKDPTGRDERPGGSGGHDQGGTWYEKSVKALQGLPRRHPRRAEPTAVGPARQGRGEPGALLRPAPRRGRFRRPRKRKRRRRWRRARRRRRRFPASRLLRARPAPRGQRAPGRRRRARGGGGGGSDEVGRACPDRPAHPLTRSFLPRCIGFPSRAYRLPARVRRRCPLPYAGTQACPRRVRLRFPLLYGDPPAKSVRSKV